MEGTQSSPLFERSATEIAERLEGLGGETALAMAREARSLASTFRGWANQRPDDDFRIHSIQALFDLNRRAMDFISRHPASNPPSSGPSSRRDPSPSSGSFS